MGERTGWIRWAALIALGGFFLYFGIEMLRGAYRLKDPLAFIAAFFASNLVILISAALTVGFIYRWVSGHRQPTARPPMEDDDGKNRPDESPR